MKVLTEKSLQQLTRAVEQSPATVVITTVDGLIEYVNPKFEEVTGYAAEEVIGENPRILSSGAQSPEFYSELWDTLLSGDVWRGEFRNKKKNGEYYWASASISAVHDDQGQITHFVAVEEDVTEQKLLAAQLAQAQKLEAIGQLAAGIAHEINTPIQYVGDNVSFLNTAFEKLLELITVYDELLHQGANGSVATEQLAQIDEKSKSIKLDFLLREIPNAIEQSRDGITRIAKIVRSMNIYSHPGTGEKVPVDLNDAIENTVNVTRNEWKHVADVLTDLDKELPTIDGLPAEINQVVLNIIVNSAQAIGEVLNDRPENKGTITIKTSREDASAVIEISDNGPGIPEDIRARVFEPFFTTKEVGKGTGQGLAIAHSVVVKKHGGTITCDSEAGDGTTFTIHLPIEQAHKKEGVAA